MAEKVLAIGLDAGDYDFIQTHLPALPNIGRFFTEVPVHLLTLEPLAGSVWSTFCTRSSPGDHGFYHHIQWNAKAMRMQRSHPDWLGELTPFWRALAKDGRKVTALDIPFVFEGESHGALEIINWGSHDLVGAMWASLPSEARRIRSSYGIHPMGFEVPVHKTVEKLKKDRDDIVRGTQIRTRLVKDLMDRRPWDLFLVAFGETHRAGHLLQPIPGEEDAVPQDGLLDVYKAVDKAIGEICEMAGPECDIVLFALHGMGPNQSQSHLTRPMLNVMMGAPSKGGSKDVAKTGLVRWLRQSVPAPLQHAIAQAVPTAVRDFVVAREIAGGITPGITKMISLDGDLSGYWRFMVKGRERAGALQPTDIDRLRTQLTETFTAFKTPDGVPLVKQLHFPALDIPGRRVDLLPDVVAEWDPDLAPASHAVHPVLGDIHGNLATGRGGNHRFRGFFAHRGPRQGQGPTPQHIKDLGGLIHYLAE